MEVSKVFASFLSDQTIPDLIHAATRTVPSLPKQPTLNMLDIKRGHLPSINCAVGLYVSPCTCKNAARTRALDASMAST